MAGNANTRNNLFIYLFSVFLMITSFTQCFSERIKHTISKAIIRQQIMSLGPFIKTSNSKNARYFRMLIQVYKRRLYKSFKRSRILILKNSARRPLTTIRLFRTTLRSNITRGRVPARS